MHPSAQRRSKRPASRAASRGDRAAFALASARSHVYALPIACGLGLLVAGPFGCGEPPPPRPAPQASASASATASAAASVDVEPTPVDDRFAVATEHPAATTIALDVLKKGGNAFDAAIAATLAIGVVHPVSSGLGGGGFAMLWDAKKGAPVCLDFRETAPMGLRPSELSTRPPKEERRGVLVGVPGEVAGLFEIHKRHGKLAFSELVRGPAELADKGFAVSPHLARALGWKDSWVLGAARYALFAPQGKLAVAGELVKNPALAQTLRRIGAEGRAAFYQGAIAADVLASASAAKSPLAQRDLDGYQVIERKPLRVEWEGHEVLAMPPPSAGGLMLAQALRMHTKAELEKLGQGSAAYTHLLAETFRGSVADRVRYVGDPAFVKVDVDALASKERMAERKARFRADATTQADKFPVKDAGTTHLVVVDAEGNVASLTSTVNNLFGARIVTQGGFVLNDELDDFTPPALEKRFGLQRGPNAPKGGARPTSSMSPTIVLQGGKPVLSLGGSGGTRIATGVAQVALSHLVFGTPVADAVAAPRFDVPPTGGLWLDAGTDALKELKELLVRSGEVVDDTRPNYSAVQAISIREAKGRRALEAGADPRKGGGAAVE